MPYNNYKRRPQGYADGGIVGRFFNTPVGASAPDSQQEYEGKIKREADSLVRDKLAPASRISPINSMEYINEHQSPSYLGLTYPSAINAWSGDPTGTETSSFSKDSYNDPTTQRHERIHVGQLRLGVEPTDRQVATAMGSSGFQGLGDDQLADRSKWGGVYGMEKPAYSFEDYHPDRGMTLQDYGRYINLLKGIGGSDRGISSIEVSVPTQLERDYLKTTPVQVGRPAAIEALRRKIASGLIK